MELNDYLKDYREEMPAWLENYENGAEVTFKDVMSGRVGYYPGSGYDGTLMKVANKAHAVHSFLYVDYGMTKETLEAHLAKPRSINGYHSIGRIEWEEKDLTPHGQYPLVLRHGPAKVRPCRPLVPAKPYCFTEILERDADKDDTWGAKRFALTLLYADGIATYYQLFCCEYKKAPWIMLLIDHGFGGNYDKFGKGGLLDAIMSEYATHPTYVLCHEYTPIWDGYERVECVEPTNGGMHYDKRWLYRRAL